MQTQSRASIFTLANILRSRRTKLAQQFDQPVLLWSERASSRNFPANTYPFRASSHFLYFAGLPLQNAAIHLDQGRLTLFMDDPTPDDILWHGSTMSRADIAEQIGADADYPYADLKHWTEGAATMPLQNSSAIGEQQQVLQRQIGALHDPRDRKLAKTIVQLRLIHDEGAISEIRRAATVTVNAHRAGMAATRSAKTEAAIRAAMEQVIQAHNMTCAYTSIVTVHGEVLHNNHYHHPVQAGDLLLADVGAETENGWASDVTRTWPISGRFSATQRDVYQIVLAAHDACIAAAKPGVEYQDLHLLACRTIAEGLVNLGILNGQPDSLVEQDAHALFFPHGVGHLLGLDVHDMEDLGDLAGYADGRQRSERFGLGFLRLHRPLQAGMVVTIEPGFYQVPAILHDSEKCDRYREIINWERLAEFADVRGIRIEDDVLITDTGCEVITTDLPTQADEIEALVNA